MKPQTDLLAAALTTRGPKKTTNKVRASGNREPAPSNVLTASKRITGEKNDQVQIKNRTKRNEEYYR